MKPSTKKNLIIAAGYTAIFIAGMFLGPKFARENENRKNGTFLPFLNGRSEKFTTILNLIDSRYVDEVSADSLKEMAIDEILSHLDPHSAYLPPVEASLMNEDLEGNFYGIGIEYFILNDTLTVASVNTGGPAYKAGMERGDQIISINSKPVTNIGITGIQVISAIRGKRGTFVNLLIKNGRTGKLRNLKIARDKISVNSIAASYLINNSTGYIKVEKFGGNTAADFTSALATLKKQGMKNLILDLRNNGGGYLSAATALADHFLGDSKLIVYTQGAHEKRKDYRATDKGDFETGKLAVLINENTASASEIVAGAVQDLDRGVIIGQRSFGKGLVQEQIDFGDGSTLNLTVARYYTPSGRSIQKPYKKGIKPNGESVSGNDFLQGEKYTDTLDDKSHPYHTSSGKLVYGGGGILPDITLPVDTVGYTGYYEAVYAAGLINQYVYGKLVKQLKPASINDLLTPGYIAEKDFDQFEDFVRSKGIAGKEDQAALSEPHIRKDMRALVARYYFGDAGFYRVENAQDKAIQKALEQFR